MKNQEAFVKFAHALRRYAVVEQACMMQKTARGGGVLARLQNLFRAAPPPPPAPAGMTGAQALLAALGVGGAALAAPHIAGYLGGLGVDPGLTPALRNPAFSPAGVLAARGAPVVMDPVLQNLPPVLQQAAGTGSPALDREISEVARMLVGQGLR